MRSECKDPFEWIRSSMDFTRNSLIGYLNEVIIDFSVDFKT